jgi:glucokinase
LSRPEFAIGIDIGGGSTKIGLVSSIGKIVDRTRIVIDDGDDADEIIDKYVKAIAGMIAANPTAKLTGIGIGFPGRIHPDNMSGNLGNVPALDDMPLAMRLGDAFALPALMQNDATAAGMAEAMFGNDKMAERLLLITAGTGIGVAFTVGGKPFVTSGGGLGDAGHIIVNHQNPTRCRQGCLGCLESVASGDALNRQALGFVRDNPKSALARCAAESRKPANVSDIIRCARQGDHAATAMLADAGRWIGRAVVSWAHIFAPEVILIGGGLSVAGDLLLKPIEQEAQLCGLELYLKTMRFALASLGNDAGMIGAAAQMFLNSTE